MDALKKLIKKAIETFTSPLFIKYFICGFSAFMIDFIILNIEAHVLKFNPKFYVFNFPIEINNIISSFIGLTISYILNRLYAFKSDKNVIKESLKFLAVGIFNYLISNFLYSLILATIFASTTGILYNLKESITKFFVIGLQMIWTFFLYKFLVFETPKEEIKA